MWFFKRGSNYGASGKETHSHGQTSGNGVLITDEAVNRMEALRAVPKGFRMATPNEFYLRCKKDIEFMGKPGAVKLIESVPVFTYSVIGIVAVNLDYNSADNELILVNANMGPEGIAKVAYVEDNKSNMINSTALRK